MKKEIKEKIIEILKSELWNTKGFFTNIKGIEESADQILALFEGEKKKWREEIEKLIEKETDQLPVDFLSKFYKRFN